MSAFQWWIAVFGLATVYLAQERSLHVRRWAVVCGLAAQPAWWVETLRAEQYGMFILTVGYTLGYCRGLWTLWIKPETA